MFIGSPPAVGSRPGEGGGRVAAPGDAPGDHDEDGGDDHDVDGGDDYDKDSGDDQRQTHDTLTSTILHIIN